MKLLLSGSSGLIGSALKKHWQQHQLHVIQQHAETGVRQWGQTLALDNISPLDAVVHLAGSSIATQRWSDKRKQQLLRSRLDTTEQLVAEILSLEHKPAVFLCASAIGYYGDGEDTLLLESSPPDDSSFSSQLCQQWEAACQPLIDAGIRVVNLRFGIVLSASGGALANMLPAFKLGAGGKLGSGTQWMSWIAMEDLLTSIDHIIKQTDMHGPINITSPSPVINSEFSSALSSSLNRPCFFHMPSAVVKLLFGQMGTELLLSSAKVLPQRLIDSGYTFQHPNLQSTLNRLFKKDPANQ